MAHAFAEVDTIVLDLDDRDVPRVLPSLDEIEDVDMQVMLDDGHWHRKAADDPFETACDEPQRIHYGRINGTRQQGYEGQPCRGGCFSRSELAKFEQANDDAREAAHGFARMPRNHR